MKIKIFMLLVLLLPAIVFSQPGSLNLGILIDTPAAKLPDRGEIQSGLSMYSNGGLLGSILIGLSPRFALGVSYGGENIIGTGDINLNPQPSVEVRYLLFEEKFLFPAIQIGFNSQGYGAYNKDLKRYSVKSMGLYAVASKNTSFLGGLGIHGGINISLENSDGDKDPNIFFGCHKQINSELVIIAEYNTAINDNSDNAIGSGKGYLNCGIRWIFAKQVFVEFDMKNLFENGQNVAGSSREVKLYYTTHF
ncbi:hypothetical protein DRQ07_05285 [candidate division KSB1 bacterium]|nr:MAG: hypothetical protein DRQ07_05285 [candidate division KSB1 bacterium]